MKMMMSTEGQTLPDDSSAGEFLPDRILRLPEVLELYPVSRSTWYEGVIEPASLSLNQAA